MLKTFGQLRQEIAQLSAIQDSNGNYNFDDSTFPTLSQANVFINDAIREISSSWDYTFLQSSRSYPFYHNMSGVQGAYFSGYDDAGSGYLTVGSRVPFPNDVLNYSWIANNQQTLINVNFSGVQFSGVSSGVSYSSLSVGGYPTYSNIYSGVGYTYQLDQDVDKILACMISKSNSGNTSSAIMMTHVDWHDIERIIPIGVINASGTPVYYSEFPGFGPINNKTIQFFPFPTPNYQGENFIIHYKKKHVDMVSDNDLQSVVPEQYQAIITQATLEKVFDLLDNPKAALASQRRMDLEGKMRVWDAQQPNKMWQWQDFRYNSTSNRAYDNSTNVWIPYD